MLVSNFFIKVNNVVPVSKKKCGFVYEHVTNVLVHDITFFTKIDLKSRALGNRKLTSDGVCGRKNENQGRPAAGNKALLILHYKLFNDERHLFSSLNLSKSKNKAWANYYCKYAEARTF